MRVFFIRATKQNIGKMYENKKIIVTNILYCRWTRCCICIFWVPQFPSIITFFLSCARSYTPSASDWVIADQTLVTFSMDSTWPGRKFDNLYKVNISKLDKLLLYVFIVMNLCWCSKLDFSNSVLCTDIKRQWPLLKQCIIFNSRFPRKTTIWLRKCGLSFHCERTWKDMKEVEVGSPCFFFFQWSPGPGHHTWTCSLDHSFSEVQASVTTHEHVHFTSFSDTQVTTCWLLYTFPNYYCHDSFCAILSG